MAEAVPYEEARRIGFHLQLFTRISEPEAVDGRKYAFDQLNKQTLVAPGQYTDPYNDKKSMEWLFNADVPEQVKLWLETRTTGRGWHSVDAEGPQPDVYLSYRLRSARNRASRPMVRDIPERRSGTHVRSASRVEPTEPAAPNEQGAFPACILRHGLLHPDHLDWDSLNENVIPSVVPRRKRNGRGRRGCRPDAFATSRSLLRGTIHDRGRPLSSAKSRPD